MQSSSARERSVKYWGCSRAHRLLLARDAVATRGSQRTFMQHNPNNLKDPTNM